MKSRKHFDKWLGSREGIPGRQNNMIKGIPEGACAVMYRVFLKKYKWIGQLGQVQENIK